MAYASVADVKRILRIEATDDDAVDARLRAALSAVEAWASHRLVRLSQAGDQVWVKFDVREDATLHLPADDLTVTKVKVFEYPSLSGVPLSPVELGLGRGFDLTDDGRLILRPTLGISPFEGATAQRALRTYSRVEVFYIGTGIVPADVTEGIAFLTAGYYTDGPKILSGITSEKIGDYSYTRAGNNPDSNPSYLDQALFFLTDYFRKGRVSVV